MVSNTFGQYRHGLLELLTARWHPRRCQQRLRTIVCFRLHRDGTVAFAEVRKPSEEVEFDHAALALVRDDLVYPPLPVEIEENAIFAFNLDSDFEEPDLHGAGVPRKPVRPNKESAAELREPD